MELHKWHTLMDKKPALNVMGTIKSERGKTIGGKIARLKLWSAKSHNWQTIGGKSAIKPILAVLFETGYEAHGIRIKPTNAKCIWNEYIQEFDCIGTPNS
ncbi:hypothetical protein MTR_4g027245 [Medicago truncatula]|uniref:Uncharacterized protein n=1 Tax=Medicago truncatula TaxID=3880 RepID=A0A072UJ86_MEDTR|nr:hypothetical protein MTR_4g027245 [Medicago truncatula]